MNYFAAVNFADLLFGRNVSLNYDYLPKMLQNIIKLEKVLEFCLYQRVATLGVELTIELGNQQYGAITYKFLKKNA